MNSQKHIQDELRSLESSLPFNNNLPYSVPEGYFEGLAAVVLAKIKSSESSVMTELGELSPLLAGIPKIMPYSVPSSYFEETVKGFPYITGETVSPLLDTIGQTMPYEVPQGYFEALPDEILSKVATPKAKVVPLFARTWMRVAAAAAVVGVLFFGGYQLLQNEQDAAPATAQQGTNSTNQSLTAANDPAIEKEIKSVSTEDLQAFIEDVQVNAAKAPADDTKVSEKDEALFSDVSVTEMESFLAAIPTANDDLLITD